MSAPAKPYVVMRETSDDAGEWVVVEECGTVLEAVTVRERHLATEGGTVVVLQALDLYELYRTAGYEEQKRQAKATDAANAAKEKEAGA